MIEKVIEHMIALAIGLPIMAIVLVSCWAFTFLPLWAIVIPLGTAGAYCFGRAALLIWEIMLSRSVG